MYFLDWNHLDSDTLNVNILLIYKAENPENVKSYFFFIIGMSISTAFRHYFMLYIVKVPTIFNMRLEVLVPLIIKIMVYWGVTSCSFICVWRQ